MRWIRFTLDGKTAYGILEGDRVAEVSGDPFTRYERTAKSHALSAVKLEVPVIPRTFYCAGLNYTSHIKEMAARRAVQPDIPAKPDIGYRANNALIAHGEPIVIPRDATEKINYEGELVVVVGKQAKHLSEADALSCVLGYTIGNDFSERTWQKSDRTLWRAKNTDTFKPMGPWIETDVELDKMQTIVRVNGKPTTEFKTNDMLFGIQTFVAAMTKYLTLYPGDVIWMGTDGVSPDLKVGNVVDVEITGIGTLSNPIAAEQR
jgi:2-keto-4-pentenoate hydratase/2-oxohepta-3-ene-1,7-dioic acid hydratase in catechol pathway